MNEIILLFFYRSQHLSVLFKAGLLPLVCTCANKGKTGIIKTPTDHSLHTSNSFVLLSVGVDPKPKGIPEAYPDSEITTGACRAASSDFQQYSTAS